MLRLSIIMDKITEELINKVEQEEVVEAKEVQQSKEAKTMENTETVAPEIEEQETTTEEAEQEVVEELRQEEASAPEEPQPETAAVTEENVNKIKQELIYGQITLSDRDIFVDPVQITARHEKQYQGDICTVTIYDIPEKDLKKIRSNIASNKAKYHSARAAKNTTTVVAGVAKGVFGGVKGFGRGVQNSFKQELKKLY